MLNLPRARLETLWLRLAGRGMRSAVARSTSVESWLTAHFAAIVAVCACAYLGVQLLYIVRLPLVMDEFDGAYDVYRLSYQVPYFDFRPYKTVLGYYLQLPPLLLARDVWSGLIATKALLAAINAVSMACAAVLAARVFRPSAVALALPLWVFMSNWLERSSELRVDTLTSLAGLFSLLLLLAGKPAVAGCLAGLSFLVSQKGVYFFAASLAALIATLAQAAPRGPALRMLLRFCIAYAATVGMYLVTFTAVAFWETTASSTFLSHRAIAFSDIYPRIRKYWAQSLGRNPFFYGLALAGLVALGLQALRSLGRRGDDPAARRDLLLFGYGVALGACLIWHKQPWPYFFVLLVPTCFLLHAAAIETATRLLEAARCGPRARIAIGAALLAMLLLAGVVAPASRVPALARQESGYQREMVRAAAALLGPAEHYLAGVDLLYDRHQSTSALRRVSRARRIELKHADKAQVRAIVDDLRKDPPKLLVHNERFRAFPSPVKRFLRAHYAEFWGSIRLYAPRFRARSKTLTLRFSGTYRVSTEDGSSVRVDGRTLHDGQTLALEPGRVRIRAASDGRLALTAPALQSSLDARFQKPRPLFADVYTR